jgi:N-acylneuraminate cytidylyltransferase/CMP-N,N'-diacetyllegionaminic acid synthase
MHNPAHVLGLILARSGSKGLPAKNTMMLGGKPLLAWSVEAAIKSSFVTDVIISTDSVDIATTAAEYGAEVPFIRPDHLSTDTSTSADAVAHAIEFLQERNRHYDYVILLEPTSPLRDFADIDEAFIALLESGGSSLVSVCRASTTHPAFMFNMGAENILSPYESSRPIGSIRRQDVDEVYYPEGSIYISSIETFEKEHSFYHRGTQGFEVPRWKALEIDEALDFLLVQAVMRERGIIS